MDFDPGPDVARLSNGQDWYEGFLWKLDADGNYVTAKRMGGDGSDQECHCC